jgi:hypothetical protein
MNVLVLNSGSATVKFQVIEIEGPDSPARREHRLAHGVIDLFGPEARSLFEAAGGPAHREVTAIPDHRAAIEGIIAWVCSAASGIPHIPGPRDVGAVGHRGGGLPPPGVGDPDRRGAAHRARHRPMRGRGPGRGAIREPPWSPRGGPMIGTVEAREGHGR